MNKIIDRLILLLICIVCVLFLEGVKYSIVVVLIMISYMGIAFYNSDSKWHPLMTLIAGLPLAVSDAFIPIIPLVAYECSYGLFQKKYREIIALCVVFAGYIASCVIKKTALIPENLQNNPVMSAIIAGLLLLAVYLAYNNLEISKLQKEKLKIRDDSEELRQLMIMKNQLLRKQQDSDITMATLKERNRIAREIHDNVGHLLSRSILQVGALRIMCKDEPVAEALVGLQDTLNESMTNVRRSVHDLHDESFDFYKAVKDLTAKHNRFKTDFDYDMSDSIPRNIKYCMFSIITEAFQNAEKYSDGDKIFIVAREHPGIYQLLFQDNGKNAAVKESGIGLHNMQSRVDELNGTLAITTDSGFKIFISIPRKGE